MAAAMTLTNKSSIVNNSSKHSSPIINQRESYSPASSTTLSPESTNSISSPDKSFVLNEQQQQLQQQSIRLVDYFVVCGINKYVDVEPSSDITGEQILNPFQCSYRGRVLYHYPNDVLNNPFDEDAISRLSMPDGVSIRLNSPDPPTTHPFLITRLDGTRYYGVALTFYEQLDNNNDDEIYTENSSSTAFISLNRLIENYNRTSRHQQRRSSSLIIYASKVICLIGPLAHYSTFKRILELLYRMTIEHDLLGLPFEAHLYNILHELHIPSPSLSHSVLKFNVGERQLTVWQPSINDDDLPLLDFNLLEFFSLLGVEGVIDLVTCALLEHQIILKSSDYTRLMLVAECLTALLFPFQWTLLYVPIVFTAALVCLDVPVPAIMGLRINKSNANKDNDNDGDDNADDDDDDGYSDTSDDANFEVQRCVVHIDTGRIQLPDDMPRFPDRSCFRSELHDILSRFDNYFNRDLTTVDYLKKQRRIQGSEDWTHVDNQQIKNESKDEPSQALTRLSAIAKRAGIVLNNNEDDNSNEPLCLFNEFEINQISANNCLRSSFVNRFAQLFSQMDAFICYPPSGKYSNIDQWLAQRSTTKNFDRTMFIADQPKPHVPFLLAFMETQSFVSFVDSKIAARFNEDNLCFGLTHKHLQFFSDRIRLYRDRRDLTYQPCTSIDLIDNRTRLRFTSPFPSSLIIVNASIVRPLNTSISTSNNCYLFENLNGNILESSSSVAVNISSPLSSGISKRNSRLTRSFQSKHTPRRVTRIKKQQTLATGEHQQPVVLVENEVVFQQLLKECTTKTKRMVIEKMEDIVEGSSPIKNNESTSMVNLEENVLIAGFCDLLERIWSHGLHHRPSGKSALWNHIKCYVKLKNYESAQISHGGLPVNYTKDENPALVWCLMRKQLVNRSVSATRSESPGGHRSHTLPRPQMSQHQPRSSPILSMTNSTLSLLPSDNLMKNHPSSTSLLYDFRSIELCFGHNPVSLSASEIGFARAFVRLALERRLLSRHLSELFSHSDLLQALYKRDAFLRADDGDLRKQFLAHVESLQLLDYKCFSNSYADIDIIYHVTIVPTRARTTGISSTTTANPYIAVAGILGSTKVIPLPSKNTPEVKFKHKNLGQLTTLRIGHDNTGLMPRWNLDHVLVRNQLTNNVYRFPCGRWLGKGVDDDSLERLLFVDTTGSFEMNDNPTNGTFESGSPSQLMTTSMISGGSQLNLSVAGRSRSPSLRRANDQKNPSNQQADDIYELLGRSINQLVKYFDDPEKKRGLITPILCGEDGLVNALEKTLSYGLKKPTSNLSFFGGGRKRYVWDFLIKVCDEYDARRSQWQRSEREKAIICYINGVRSIEKALATFGKDGRFQSWCCFACKLHLLSDWFRLLSQCSDACLTQFYDPLNNCFRQKKLNQFINNILEPVKDFDFAHLEPALLKGLAGV
ncbi:unnamed protein product [Adineta steineri]|uniref:Uncharacterized protein n=1 Tax=Adineta steineri TaxID=433720 RepID=A0A816DFW1_9BILA|nr:unnamed protein product [Adineta steineri]CAF1636747.1 unnamed protein product [Adineta steineri]